MNGEGISCYGLKLESGEFVNFYRLSSILSTKLTSGTKLTNVTKLTSLY